MKPRIAEYLGVEVGQWFYIDLTKYCIREDGSYETDTANLPYAQACLLDAINNPSIIRKILTNKEIELCKLIGAKYVTRNEQKVGIPSVCFWDDKPVKHDGVYSSEFNPLGNITPSLMPSVRPGDIYEIP